MNDELQALIEFGEELQTLLKKVENLPAKKAWAFWDQAAPLIMQMLRRGALVAEKYGREKEFAAILRKFNREIEAGIIH
jgi:hypothetical protein